MFMSLGLLLPWVNHFTGWWKQENTENRNPSEWPGPSLAVEHWPGRIDTALSDRFPLRSSLMRGYGRLNLAVFHKSPIPTMAYLGSDGWMYITRKELATFDGSLKFSPGETDSLKWKLLHRKRRLDSLGIRSLLVIAPVKQSIYPEFQPAFIRRLQAENRTDLLLAALRKAGYPVLDLRDSLRSAKRFGVRMYHKSDNHWNRFGGFMAARSIAAATGVDVNDENWMPGLGVQADSSGEQVSGNIAEMMALGGIAKEPDVRAIRSQSEARTALPYNWPTPVFSNSWEYQLRYTRSDSSRRRVLLIRDSFGSDVVPYFAEACGELCAIFDEWNYGLNWPSVKAMKPHWVITMVIESNLDHLLYRTPYAE
jgi:hypothetical protein